MVRPGILCVSIYDDDDSPELSIYIYMNARHPPSPMSWVNTNEIIKQGGEKQQFTSPLPPTDQPTDRPTNRRTHSVQIKYLLSVHLNPQNTFRDTAGSQALFRNGSSSSSSTQQWQRQLFSPSSLYLTLVLLSYRVCTLSIIIIKSMDREEERENER